MIDMVDMVGGIEGISFPRATGTPVGVREFQLKKMVIETRSFGSEFQEGIFQVAGGNRRRGRWVVDGGVEERQRVKVSESIHGVISEIESGIWGIQIWGFINY